MKDSPYGKVSENLAIEWEGDPFGYELWHAIEKAEGDLEGSIAAMEGLAEKGSVLSMTYLGDLYFYGRFGAIRDLANAQYWLSRASEGGSIEGEYLLALCLENLDRFEEAFQHYLNLSDKGYAPAMFALGYEYWKGNKLEKNLQSSMKFFDAAIKLGHVHASLWVSYLMRSGALGVKYRPIGCIRWFGATFSAFRVLRNNPKSDRLRH